MMQIMATKKLRKNNRNDTIETTQKKNANKKKTLNQIIIINQNDKLK